MTAHDTHKTLPTQKHRHQYQHCHPFDLINDEEMVDNEVQTSFVPVLHWITNCDNSLGTKLPCFYLFIFSNSCAGCSVCRKTILTAQSSYGRNQLSPTKNHTREVHKIIRLFKWTIEVRATFLLPLTLIEQTSSLPQITLSILLYIYFCFWIGT